MHARAIIFLLATLVLLLLGCPSPQIEQAPIILFPASGAVYEEGSLVSFTASSEAVWTSSLDGELGSGKAISIALSPGEHCISAESAEGAASSINLVILPVEYVCQGRFKFSAFIRFEFSGFRQQNLFEANGSDFQAILHSIGIRL